MRVSMLLLALEDGWSNVGNIWSDTITDKNQFLVLYNYAKISYLAAVHSPQSDLRHVG